MTYESYAYIRNLIDADMQKLEHHFRIACGFIPSETPKKGESGITKAHKIFLEKHSEILRAKEEFFTAAANMYKDHPNPEMRKFWGLE